MVPLSDGAAKRDERVALPQVRIELAQLPHAPPPPAMLPSFPFVQPLADDKLLALFATEEAAL